ncbi:MAG TPA: hypothetical protein VKJ65_02560 [Phycisphaerae bacterium]|nr:hypothetical protein [Phycisphaerae bacterium]
MVLNIPLSRQTEAGLKRRASSVGQDVVTYTARLLETVIKPRTLKGLSGSMQQKFIKSGISDAQLGEELEKAKHKMRAHRRAQKRK